MSEKGSWDPDRAPIGRTADTQDSKRKFITGPWRRTANPERREREITNKSKRQFGVELIRRGIQQKPGEEDMWLVVVVTEDESAPSLDSRYAFLGTYERATRHAGGMVDGLMGSGYRKRLQIEAYQGEGVSKYYAHMAATRDSGELADQS
jgi:hypothetical protein